MKRVLTISGVMVLFGVAYADEGADWDYASKETDKAVESVASESYCGGSVNYAFDKDSFRKAKKTDFARRCGDAIGTLGSFCYAHPTAKADILSKVKSFTCHYDPNLKSTDHHALRFKKSGTNVDVFMNADSSNFLEEGVGFFKEDMPLIAELTDWEFASKEADKAVELVAQESYCGGKVSYSFDKESYRKAKKTAFSSRCGEAVGTLGSYCYSHANAKASILSAVKSFTCHYDPTLKFSDHHAMKFKKTGTNIDVFMNTDSSNFSDEALSFYKKSLKTR